MKFVSYLSFAGNCRGAFEFYARILGGEIVAMITHGETPAGEHVSRVSARPNSADSLHFRRFRAFFAPVRRTARCDAASLPSG
jgi:uncharacterized glyoxalase superfamily protein PhnB